MSTNPSNGSGAKENSGNSAQNLSAADANIVREKSAIDYLATFITEDLNDTVSKPSAKLIVDEAAQASLAIVAFIKEYIPVFQQEIHFQEEITTTLVELVQAVKSNAKSYGAGVPNLRQAVDLLNDLASSGFLDQLQLIDPSADKVAKVKQIASEDALISAVLGEFKAHKASGKNDSAPEQDVQQSNFNLATINSLSESTSYSPERVQEIFTLANVNKDDVDDLVYLATGHDRLPDDGVLIEGPKASASLTGMINLLEDGFSKEMVAVLAALKNLLDGHDGVAMPDLITEYEIRQMSESDAMKIVNSPFALSSETILDFCNEFCFDIEEAATSQDAADQIAQAIIDAVRIGTGKTYELKLNSLIECSRGLRGNAFSGDFSAIARLFVNNPES